MFKNKAWEQEEDDPTFETLFSQLAQFRDSANALPSQQRRAMAEDLALKFYAAIGGGDSSAEEDEGATNP